MQAFAEVHILGPAVAVRYLERTAAGEPLTITPPTQNYPHGIALVSGAHGRH